MLGASQAAAAVTVANNTPSKNEVGRAVIGAAVAQRGAVLAAETADYTLTNLEFRCVRYHMGPEFDMIEANVLQGGQKYRLCDGFQIILFNLVVLFLLIIKLLQKDFQFQLNH
jgi:hypothetical protein